MDHFLETGSTYFISFVGSLDPDYTHYSDEAVLLREISEDFGTNEKHYAFRILSGEECYFPKSSIHPSWHLLKDLQGKENED